MDEIKSRCERILEFAPEGEFDDYAAQHLKKKIYKWKESDKKKITSLEYFVNGKEYSLLLDALYLEKTLSKIKIKFLKPVLNAKWNFSKPTREIMEKKGRALVRSFEFDPDSLNPWACMNKIENEKVMMRAFISDFFLPISIQTKSQYHHAQDIPRMYDPHLKKLQGVWKDVKKGIVPFEIIICAYTPKDRYMYVIDPLENIQKNHPLHTIPYHYKVSRGPLEYIIFDTLFAYMDLHPLVKKMFLFIFECGEITVPDIAHKFNVPERIALNNLNALISKNLLKVRKNLYYDIAMDEVKARAEVLSRF
ncbi:MAG: hypothetical protein R6U17_07465 [Thermoplasmata archaeon]